MTRAGACGMALASIPVVVEGSGPDWIVTRVWVFAMDALAAGLMTTAAAAQEVTLRAVSSFAEKTQFSRNFERFIDPLENPLPPGHKFAGFRIKKTHDPEPQAQEKNGDFIKNFHGSTKIQSL